MSLKHYSVFIFLLVIIAAAWGLLYVNPADLKTLLAGYGHFFFIGLLGAIVANSTGSGGGVIFIPFFSAMGLTSQQVLGTSIFIQCFGMTAGSFSWLLSMRKTRHSFKEQSQLIKYLLVRSGIATITGVLVAQYWVVDPGISMTMIFRWFSVLLGISLLINALSHHKKHHSRHNLSGFDRSAVLIVSFLGGMLVAWISIGVGEWIALYLIFRRFPTMVAICIGVCVSSIAVLTASIYHVWVVSNVVWEILLFAAPAAVIGGIFAKHLSFRLGPGRLKIFFGTWILVTGLIM